MRWNPPSISTMFIGFASIISVAEFWLNLLNQFPLHMLHFFFFFFFKCRGLWKELSKLFPTAISANLFCWKVSNRCRKWNDDVNPLDHEQFWCQHVEPFFPTKHSHPVGIYLLKVNYRNTIVSFWCLYCQLWTYFTPCFSVSFVNFKHVIAGWASTYCHIDCVYNILFWFTFY